MVASEKAHLRWALPILLPPLPVPGEHAFYGYHNVFPIRGNDLEKNFRIGLHVPMFSDRSLCIHDTDIHSFRVQVDSTIIFVLPGVELHKASSFEW
jgi:hypothetical protein